MSLKISHTHNSALFEYILLAIIVLVGAVLRFWDFQNIPFMHDEFSALGRLRFDSFSDLINKGVLPDGHPAGVQVFLYYWTALVGTSEPMVKLPFIVFGILSIWVSYLIGRLWFDGTTGLLTATYISSLQFFVMYSQIARPYISGLFITLMMVYAWSLFFFKKRKIIYLILYVLFSAMAAYNHHFSLLFAAIVGLSGLFFVKKKDILMYSLAGVVIFILYIPHLNIFFSQLGYGGLGGMGGWLAKPKPIFIFQFLNWIFHLSTLTWGALVGTILFIILENGNFVLIDSAKRKRWLLLAWFLLPIIIGYAYSVLRSPVIQYSMLIFSTPYLFILLFSYHKNISFKQKILLVVVLLLVNTSTLVFNRQYYKVFYSQPYEEALRTALVDNNAEDVFLIDGCIPYYDEYYFTKYGKRVPNLPNVDGKTDLTKFEEVVSNIKENKVVTEGLTGEQVQIVQSYFPYQIGYKNGFTYEVYTFSRKKPSNKIIINRDEVAQTNFKTSFGNWKHTKDMTEYDSTAKINYCIVKPSTEWGPSVSFELSDIAPKGLGVIDVEMEIMMPDTVTKYLIASTITKDKELISWMAIDIKLYKLQKGKWRKVFFTVDIQNAIKSRRSVDGMNLKINIWNTNKNKLLIKYINIYRKPGNPVRFGLYNKIYR